MLKKILAFLLIACLLLCSLSLLTGCAERLKYEEEDTYKAGVLNTPSKGITAVEVYWTSGEVEIRGVLISELGVSGVTVWEDYTADNEYTLRTRIKNGVLQVYPAESGAKLDSIPKKNLTIDLPLDLAYSLERITVTALGDTKVTLEKTSPAALTVNAEAGDVILQGNPGTVEVTTTSGDLKLTSGKATETSLTSLRFTSEDGNAELSLDSYGFTAKMEGTSGHFTSDYETSASGGIYSYGTQKSAMVFHTAGLVAVRKQAEK